MRQGYIIIDGVRKKYQDVPQFCKQCSNRIDQPKWTHRFQKFCNTSCKVAYYKSKYRKLKNYKTNKWFRVAR